MEKSWIIFNSTWAETWIEIHDTDCKSSSVLAHRVRESATCWSNWGWSGDASLHHQDTNESSTGPEFSANFGASIEGIHNPQADRQARVVVDG